jgi:inner membrane protein
MPTPVGHSLMGYIIYGISSQSVEGTQRRLIPLYLLAANAADLDFLPGLLVGDANRYHHRVSHSIGFAIIFALVFSLFPVLLKRDVSWRWRNFAILFCLYCSHIGLDYFATDGGFPYGVAVFWPVSGEFYISPIALFADIRRSPFSIDFFPSLFSLHNLRAVSIEVLLLLPFALLILLKLWGGRAYRRATEPSGIMRLFNKVSPQMVHGGETPPRRANPLEGRSSTP